MRQASSYVEQSPPGYASDNGNILLGVREEEDGRLVPEVVDATKLEKDFWNMVNNLQKISANIVTRSMVKIDPIS